MIGISTADLDRLTGSTQIEYRVYMRIDSVPYYFTTASDIINAPAPDSITNVDWLPAYIDQVGDVEITSEPRIGNSDVTLNCHDGALISVFMGNKWLNSPCEKLCIISDDQGVILEQKIYSGLISEVTFNERKRTAKLSISPAFANPDKVSGIRTNVKSQQRYYPNCTGFRHSAEAIKKVYWGKNDPNRPNTGGTTVVVDDLWEDIYGNGKTPDDIQNFGSA